MPRALNDQQNANVRRFAAEARDARGWTDTRLGEAIKRSQGQMSRLMSGKDGTTLEVASLLAELEGLELEAMLRGERVTKRSVRALPGYAEAYAALIDRSNPNVLAAATRALDAVGAVEVNVHVLKQAMLFAQDFMPVAELLKPVEPATPVPMTGATKLLADGVGTTTDAAAQGERPARRRKSAK